MLKTKAGDIIGNRAVVSVPEAGKIVEISRDAAYRAAAKGELPTLKIGGLIKVPTKALLQMIGGDS
jgi:hypothetical protein